MINRATTIALLCMSLMTLTAPTLFGDGQAPAAPTNSAPAQPANPAPTPEPAPTANPAPAAQAPATLANPAATAAPAPATTNPSSAAAPVNAPATQAPNSASAKQGFLAAIDALIGQNKALMQIDPTAADAQAATAACVTAINSATQIIKESITAAGASQIGASIQVVAAAGNGLTQALAQQAAANKAVTTAQANLDQAKTALQAIS
ncbi:MAG: hypothetical protein QG604_92 [Candidatus Dependentiae bacterium]|nr:hypothetical protein [Candidatus Dependentiae bacterium]